jgi:glycosyltransferase involved in cell wall biosynthesis
MKISIALCTYNGEEFLSAQLESFLSQTRLPDELIVCDDCSNDKTIEILENFSANSPFEVRIFRNENNLGSTKNFEKAISLCTGEICFLSDQDDVWMPEKIALFETHFIENKDVGMIFSDAEIVDENLNHLHKSLWYFTFQEHERSKEFFDVLMRKNVVTGATMAFRAEFRDLFLPIPTHIPNIIHDGWISLVIASRAAVKFIERPLIKYRQHSKQQLGINWDSQRKRLFKKNKQRNAEYQKSLLFYENERERLLFYDDILRDFPQFQTEKIQNSIDEIVRINLEEKNEIIKHYTVRMNLPNGRLKRIFPVFRELKSGRYARFSKGWKSAAKDLIETII